MGEFLRLLGIALIVAAVAVPASYCTIRDNETKSGLHMACIANGGVWSNGFGGWCKLPEDRPNE